MKARLGVADESVAGFVAPERSRSTALTIEVTVREAGRETLGYEGSIVRTGAEDATPAHWIERLPRLPPDDAILGEESRCSDLFGDAVATALEREP